MTERDLTEAHRITKEVRYRRLRRIPEPVCTDEGRPILTSVWVPSKAQLTEYKKVPFYKAVTFTGRTFPHVVRNLMRLYSDEGDRVYDPMLGSGTTLYEGVRLKRDVLGSDLNSKTVKNFKDRWKRHGGGYPLPSVCQSNAEDLRHVESGSIQLVIMSFPWFQSWKFSDQEAESAERSMEKRRDIPAFVDQATSIYQECERILKPGGFACNIMGNTFIKGIYYPVTLHMIKSIEAAKLEMWYQFWNLRVDPDILRYPWSRSSLDFNAKKASQGVGWDYHEDILIARKEEHGIERGMEQKIRGRKARRRTAPILR